MKHPATRSLFALWNEWRGTARAPERETIDPAALRAVLADTFVVSADHARSWPLKSLGERTRCLFATAPGESFLDLWHAEDRADVELLLSGAQEDCVPVQASARAEPPSRDPIGLDLLILPLQHRGQPDRRLLGTLVPLSLPSWYGLEASGSLRLGRMRSLPISRPDEREQQAVDWPGRPADQTDATAPRGRPRLTLIEGGLIG